MEELIEGETEGQDEPQGSQEIRKEDCDKTRADPSQTLSLGVQSPVKVGTTIYMETVKFLLQSCALQVFQRLTKNTTHVKTGEGLF